MINKVFSAVAASAVAFSTLSSAAYAQSIETRSLQDRLPTDNCRINVPAELSREEAARREARGQELPVYVDNPTDTHFFQNDALPLISSNSDMVSVELRSENIEKQSFDVNRITRFDETVTVDDSALHGLSFSFTLSHNVLHVLDSRDFEPSAALVLNDLQSTRKFTHGGVLTQYYGEVSGLHIEVQEFNGDYTFWISTEPMDEALIDSYLVVGIHRDNIYARYTQNIEIDGLMHAMDIGDGDLIPLYPKLICERSVPFSGFGFD